MFDPQTFSVGFAHSATSLRKLRKTLKIKNHTCACDKVGTEGTTLEAGHTVALMSTGCVAAESVTSTLVCIVGALVNVVTFLLCVSPSSLCVTGFA